MEKQKPLSLAEARRIVKEKIALGPAEIVPVSQAVGRVLARPARSDIDVTPFDDSAMDGFAVIAADLQEASADVPVGLACVAHLGAGSCYADTLLPGQCVRIMTGAPIPDGADTVVRIEDVRFEGAGSVGDTVLFSEPVRLGRHIRRAGEEARAGDVIMEAGEIVQPAGVGLLASCGNLQVEVYARPKVALLTIGSELVDASEMPGPGMIRDSNRWAMEALIRAAGAVPVVYSRVADDAESIKTAFLRAAQDCDLVVSTGGACAGDFDLTPGIVAELGEVFFSRVAMKPGKSQPFGCIGGVPVFVLSGNPGAASIGFEMYVRLALRIMQGYTDLDRPLVKAKLREEVKKREPRLSLQRGFVEKDEEGVRWVSQFKNQSSALHGSFQKSNCLILIPEGLEGKQAGDEVTCILTGIDEHLAAAL